MNEQEITLAFGINLNVTYETVLTDEGDFKVIIHRVLIQGQEIKDYNEEDLIDELLIDELLNEFT